MFNNIYVNNCRIVAILIIFLLLPLASFQSTYSSKTILDSIVGPQYSPFSKVFTFSNGITYVDFNMLRSLLGNDTMSQENFSRFIEEYFIPTNVRLVGLSVGWEEHANTTLSDIPHYYWVDNFLSATDRYGIGVFFNWGLGMPSAKVHSWWDDFFTSRPELRSIFWNGTIIDGGEPNTLTTDPEIVKEQLKEDLKQLFDYYGKHSSWIAVAFGRLGSPTTYAQYNKTLADFLLNSTLYNFFNTIYYLRDVDSEGNHLDGTKDKIWEAFNETRPLMVFSSGSVQVSRPVDIYGASIARVDFKMNETLKGFRASWYGYCIGTPKDLILELHNQTDSSSVFRIEPLEKVKIPTDHIGREPGWQPFVEFNSSLIEGGAYSLIFKAEAGNVTNKYQLYFREYRTDDSAFFSTADMNSGKWQFQGSGILWIKDLDNNDKLIYPFQIRRVQLNEGGNLEQPFRSPGNITFNTIFIFVSDRPYDENVATIKIIRKSDGQVVGNGTIRPEYTKGMYWWLPVPLESEVRLEESEDYIVRLERMINGTGWQWSYIITDPPAAGFQGQAKVFLFKLAYLDPIFINFMRISPTPLGPETGNPGVEYDTWYAQRYPISKNASLLYIEVNVEKYGNPGDLVVRLREDNGTGQAPSDEDLQAITIPENTISVGRTWVNVTGWDVSLQAGRMYWIILSTTEAPKGNGYWAWKTEYAYEFMIRRSRDRGRIWQTIHEPCEVFIKLVTTSEVFRVEPAYVQGKVITDRNLITQSFFLNNDATIYGLLLFLNRESSDYNGLLEAQIRTDSGFDSPSPMVLMQGKLNMVEDGVTFKGLQYLDLDYPCSLKAGVKYWLVLKANARAGIDVIVFGFHDPEVSYGGTQYKAKVSIDGGSTWGSIYGGEWDLLFGLVSSPFKPYRFTTDELAKDIEIYHTHTLAEEPLRGWNDYLTIQTSDFQKELIQWFDSYTQRNWFSLDPNPPRIIQEVRGEQELFSVLDVDDNISTFGVKAIKATYLGFPKVEIVPLLTLKPDALNAVKTYYDEILPACPKPITLLNIDRILALNDTKKSMTQIWDTLGSIVYEGEYFGKEKGVLNVLFYGDQDSLTFAQSLTSTVNITFARVSDDYNLSRFYDFRTFNVIVWASDKNSMELVTQSAQKRVKNFIDKGGGFVLLSPWAEWADEIVGYRCLDQKIVSGSIGYIKYDHPIIKPYTNMKGYICIWSGIRIIPEGTSTTYVIVKDTNNQPCISTAAYGSGRSVLCGKPESVSNVSGNGYVAILTNAVFYAAGKEDCLPILWNGGFSQETASRDKVGYSLTGKAGGPILLWLKNTGPTTTFEISLNASFFQLDPAGWIALNAANWLPVARGQGSNVSIKLEVANISWAPIYIMNYTKDLDIIYSNAPIEVENAYPNQAIYEVNATRLQAIYLAIKSTWPSQGVFIGNYSVQQAYMLINGTMPPPQTFLAHTATVILGIRIVPKAYSLPSFDSADYPNLWFYDSENKLLYIKIMTAIGEQNVREMFEIKRPLLVLEYSYILSVVFVFCSVVAELLVIRKKVHL